MTIAVHIIEQAKAIRIEDECARRNIVLKGKGVARCGPCPVCGGTDRFAIHLKKQLFHCRGCDIGGDVIALVQHLDNCAFTKAIETLTGEAASRPARPVTASAKKQTIEEYEREQRRKARWLWSKRHPIGGSIAERYLREARGYTGPLPPTLAFLPPLKPEHHPALIAAFAVVAEPEPGVLGRPKNVTAIHLTRLKADGSGKAEIEEPKIIVGSPLGLPIILAPPNDLLGLAITEGIEDTLTVHQATGLGAWAAGSGSFMLALAATVPGYIEAVTIFAHPDKTGRDGAHKLATGLRRRNIEVTIEGIP